MSESQENIEAKLGAFIDDELDADGRAEIQRHLEANPSHRKLLEEMRTTRDLVRALPRAKAPPELVETLQGQLERSVLLDGPRVEDAALDLRPNRWPQVVSVAAVVLLAVGLGTVVYLALPHGNDRPTVARGEGALEESIATTMPAAARPATTPAPIDTMTLAAAAPADGMPVPRAAEANELAFARDGAGMGPTTLPALPAIAGLPQAALTTAPAASPVTPAVASVAADGPPPATGPVTITAPPGLADVGLPTTAPTLVAKADTHDLLQSTPPEGARADLGWQPDDVAGLPAGVPDDAVLIVVDASNVARANASVSRFFAVNSIPYENVGPANGSRERDLPAPNGPAGPPAESASERKAQAAESVGQSTARQQAPGPADNVGRDYRQGYGQELQRLEQQQNPQTQLNFPQAAAPGGAAFENAEAKLRDVDADAAPQQYLARKVSRAQVDALASAVGQSDAGDRLAARVIEPRSTAKDAPATRPADALRAGDEVTVTVDELVGPGVEKTNRVRVANDGTAALPMVEPVAAAGLTPDAFAAEVARRYRDASLIAKPTVTVTRAAPAATAPAATSPAAATRPTTGPLVGRDPFATTAPSTNPSADADVPVDVVVIVRAFDPPAPSTAPAPATRPTTLPDITVMPLSPATQPASTQPSGPR